MIQYFSSQIQRQHDLPQILKSLFLLKFDVGPPYLLHIYHYRGTLERYFVESETEYPCQTWIPTEEMVKSQNPRLKIAKSKIYDGRFKLPQSGK